MYMYMYIKLCCSKLSNDCLTPSKSQGTPVAYNILPDLANAYH